MAGELADGEIVHMADLRRVGNFWRDVLLVWFVPAMGRDLSVRVRPGPDILLVVTVATVVIGQVIYVAPLARKMFRSMFLSGQRATAPYKHSKCRFNHYFTGTILSL